MGSKMPDVLGLDQRMVQIDCLIASLQWLSGVRGEVQSCDVADRIAKSMGDQRAELDKRVSAYLDALEGK